MLGVISQGVQSPEKSQGQWGITGSLGYHRVTGVSQGHWGIIGSLGVNLNISQYIWIIMFVFIEKSYQNKVIKLSNYSENSIMLLL